MSSIEELVTAARVLKSATPDSVGWSAALGCAGARLVTALPELATLQAKYERAIAWLKAKEWSGVDGVYDLHCIDCGEPHPTHSECCELAAILKESEQC